VMGWVVYGDGGDYDYENENGMTSPINLYQDMKQGQLDK